MQARWISFFLALALNLGMEAYVQFSVEGEYWANLITTFSIFFIAGGTFFFLLILYAVFGIVKDCWRYIAMGMVLGLVINGIWSAAANDRRVEESRLYLYSPYKGRDSAVFELDVDTLQHFPMQLIALEKVKSIKLKSGDLQMLPKNFGDIQNLNSLHINRNPRLDVEQVVGVLEETSISDLQITFCNVRNLPIQLQNINSLQRLDLSYNDDLNLDSLFKLLAKLPNLEELSIRGMTSSSLPPSVGSLKKLKTLQLAFGNFETLPLSMLHMDSLEVLVLNETPVINSWWEHLDSSRIKFKIVPEWQWKRVLMEDKQD